MSRALALGALLLASCGGRGPQPALPVSGRVATVVVFVGVDCPVSNRYAPEILRLRDRYAPAGVAFVAAYPGSRCSEEAFRAHRNGYFPDLAALRDPDGRLAAACGATTTPEAAVFTPSGGLVYRGRIDDRFADAGVMRPAPTVRDLEDAIESVIRGKTPPVAAAPAVGCPIPP